MEKIAALEVHIQVLDRASESESDILVGEIRGALGRDSEPLTYYYYYLPVGVNGWWFSGISRKPKLILKFTFRSPIHLHFMCQFAVFTDAPYLYLLLKKIIKKRKKWLLSHFHFSTDYNSQTLRTILWIYNQIWRFHLEPGCFCRQNGNWQRV